MNEYEVICKEYVIKIKADEYDVDKGMLTLRSESRPVATFSMGAWDSVWDSSLRIQDVPNE